MPTKDSGKRKEQDRERAKRYRKKQRDAKPTVTLTKTSRLNVTPKWVPLHAFLQRQSNNPEMSNLEKIQVICNGLDRPWMGLDGKVTKLGEHIRYGVNGPRITEIKDVIG